MPAMNHLLNGIAMVIENEDDGLEAQANHGRQLLNRELADERMSSVTADGKDIIRTDCHPQRIGWSSSC